MGGNTKIMNKGGVEIAPDRVPLTVIGRKPFMDTLQKFVLTLNKEFKKAHGYPIWEDEKEIRNGGIFNGSTSFIMSPDFSDSEIVKYKKTAGDADIAFPREIAKEVYNFLEKNEGRNFTPNTIYLGNNANNENKLGNTIICIVKMEFPEAIINVQVDLELSDMVSGKQTDWSAFAHSSSFEDAKEGMKGVANKYFWRALIGSLETKTKNFVVATPASTEDKIKLAKNQPSEVRLLNFGVDSGVGAGYELMQTKYEGKDVYRAKKPGEKTYDKNLSNMLKIAFGTDKIKIKDTHSFIKVLDLTNRYVDKKTKQKALDRFMAILFGEGGQVQVIEPNEKEDIAIKTGMYLKAAEKLKLKPSKNLDKFIERYLLKTHRKSINESFRSYLETLVTEEIKKEGSKYVIYSKDGSKKLGEFNTKADAVKRLGQIEYFKNKG